MKDKPLRWVHGEVKTPPMSMEARREIGMLLRDLQEGELLALPHSRPMPGIAARCHELRVTDAGHVWRLIYRVDEQAILERIKLICSHYFSSRKGAKPQSPEFGPLQ